MTWPVEMHHKFGKILREIYESVVTQEIPEPFRELLKRLEASCREEQTQKQTSRAAANGATSDAAPDQVAGCVSYEDGKTGHAAHPARLFGGES